MYSRAFLLAFCQIFSIFFICFTFQVHAQQLNDLPKATWHVQEMSHATGNHYSLTSFRKSILYLPNDEVVTAVRFDGPNWGIVKRSNSGKQLWQVKTKGAAKGLATLNENIVVIYSDEHENKKGGLYSARETSLSKTVSAVLINGKTGKILKEKIIHSNDDACFTDSRILVNPDGSFSSILLRVTKLKKGIMDKDKEQRFRLNSEKIFVIGLNNELEVQSKEIQTPAKEELFLAAEAGPQGSFYFASLTDESVVVEHIQNDGKRIGRLESPVSLKKFFNIVQPFASVDPGNAHSFFLGLNYTSRSKDPMNESFEFNFSEKRVNGSGPQEINKTYSKGLDFVRIDGLSKAGKHTESAFKIIDIAPIKERIAVVKEKQYLSSSSSEGKTRYNHDGILIEIYDRKWKLLDRIALDRQHESFNDIAGSVGFAIKGNTLHLLANGLGGILKCATVYAKIDLEKPKLVEYKTLDRLNARNMEPIEGGAAMWLSDRVLIEYLDERGGFLKGQKDYHSIWHVLKF